MTEHKRIRIQSKILHGEDIKEHGEAIWNWSTPAGKLRNSITLFDHCLQVTGELLTVYKATKNGLP